MTPSTPSTKGFVGRDRELAELETGLAEAVAGRGGLYLLVGEPGIGKTRLAEELARTAVERGVRVLWGRCWEGEGAPPFWPWVQIFRAHAREHPGKGLAEEIGGPSVHLAAILPPELRPKTPETTEANLSVDSEHARFQVFDAVAGFFRRTSADVPLLLVLDDLHWADRASLLLLQFVVGTIRDAGILVLGAYRDVEARRAPQLREVLAQLASDGRHLPLRGLSTEEVTEFLAERSGRSPEPRFVAAVHHATEGNPFFLGETIRLLEAEAGTTQWAGPLSGAIRIPEGVRAAIDRRLGLLSEACRAAAGIASVSGREFDADVVQAVSGRSFDEIAEAIDELIGAQLVVEVSRIRGRYGFSHALVRETLYEGLSAPRRRLIHRDTARALERIHERNLQPHVAELAHHFFESITPEDAPKALDYARRAANEAALRLAFEDAARHYQRALEALDFSQADDDAARCELLLGLGESQWRAAEFDPSRDAFRRAADVAERAGIPEFFARAAIGFAGIEIAFSFAERKDAVCLALLEKALEVLDRGDSGHRAVIMADLSAIPGYGAPGRRAALAEEAIAMARRVGNRATLAWVLRTVQQGILRADNLEERLALSTEVIELADEIGDDRLAAEGHVWWIANLVEAGEIAAAEAAVLELERRAETLRDPYLGWRVLSLRALRALLDGRFDDAEAIAQQALASGQQRQNVAAVMTYGGQMFALRREQGRLEEMAEAIADFGKQYPDVVAWRCAQAWLAAELGRHEEAKRVVDAVAADGFDALFEDIAWCINAWTIGEAIAAIGDRAHAEVLYERLLPFAARFVFTTGSVCFDALSRILGLLATTLERFDEAEFHFEEALRLNGELRSPPWTAWTQYGYASMLLRRGDVAELERANDLRSRALSTARAIGMTALEQRIVATTAPPEATVEPTVAATPLPAPAGEPQFLLEGDYWTITFAGSLFRTKDMRGLQYIHRLLQEPGRELHCTEILGEAIAERGDAGEILDKEAKAAYRRRHEDLRQELEEAESMNDLGRKERARTEMDFISRELSAAVGLGGRDRRAADLSEKARLRVTKTIKLAIERIGEQNRALAYHLSSTIRTGNFCSYTPDPDNPPRWSL